MIVTATSVPHYEVPHGTDVNAVAAVVGGGVTIKSIAIA